MNEMISKQNVLATKSFAFAVRIISLNNYLRTDKKEFTLSNQVLRSGTAVGSMIREAEFAESTKDFIHKFSIALKESNETKYWLQLLHETSYLSNEMFKSLMKDCEELIKMLVATIKTNKSRL